MSILTARRTIQTNGVAAGTGVGMTNEWNPLFLDGDSGAQRMVLPYTAATQTNAVWTFEVKASAFATTNATPANVMYAAGYTATGVIKETVVGGTRTTALIGSPVYVEWEDAGCAAAWDIRVVANDTTDSLDVEFYPGDDCPKVSATVILNQVTVGP
jgi:hypothetical protein